jgi:spore germination protein
MLTFTLLPLIFVLAMLPQNIVQLYQIIEVIGIIGLVLTIGYPLILLLIAVIRKMRGDANEDDQNAAAIS